MKQESKLAAPFFSCAANEHSASSIYQHSQTWAKKDLSPFTWATV